MKQTNLNSLLLAGVITLVGGFVSSCTEEVETETTRSRIMLTIEDNGFDNGKPVTRGTKVSNISSFGVSASVYDKDAVGGYTSAGCGSYFFNESATAGSAIDYYWPTSAYKLSFFAYYPKDNAAFSVQSSSSTTGAPTYAYTVPSAIGSQLDIMTGQNVNILGGSSSPVNLTMKHRCAAINFSVTNNRSSSITLNSVSIEGVKYSGTLNEETWTLTSAVNSSSSNPFTLSYGSAIAASATANITGTSNIFLMLPQTIPAGAKVKVAIDGEDPLYADLTGSWMAGRQYNYSLAVKNNVIVVVDEESEVKDWINLTVDLGLPSGLLWSRGNLVKDSQGNYSIGAETDWGTYVSWGNIIGHNEGEGYDFGDTNYNSTSGKQLTANIPINDSAHDIALATLGSYWHLPTKEDFQELYDNTDSEWVADYNNTGVAGRKFMKKSDHSVYVFFPASGYYDGTSLYYRGAFGTYWSSSFYSATYAYRLYFDSSSVYPQNLSYRRIGFTVRPVQ